MRSNVVTSSLFAAQISFFPAAQHLRIWFPNNSFSADVHPSAFAPGFLKPAIWCWFFMMFGAFRINHQLGCTWTWNRKQQLIGPVVLQEDQQNDSQGLRWFWFVIYLFLYLKLKTHCRLLIDLFCLLSCRSQQCSWLGLQSLHPVGPQHNSIVFHSADVFMTNDWQQTLLHLMQPPGGADESVCSPVIHFFRGRKIKAGQGEWRGDSYLNVWNIH